MWYRCNGMTVKNGVRHLHVSVSFARIESFRAFNLGFNPLIKKVSKIKQSSLDWHFVILITA